MSNISRVTRGLSRATIQQIAQTVGETTDPFNADTLAGRSEGVYQHIHQVARVYPTLTAGQVIPADATAWDLGAVTQIIPAGTITQAFDLHWVNVEAMSHNATYELVLYAGDPDVEIARVRFTRVDNFTKRDAIFVESPVIAANSRIRAALACSDAGAGRQATVSLGYHLYD